MKLNKNLAQHGLKIEMKSKSISVENPRGEPIVIGQKKGLGAYSWTMRY